MYLFVYGTLMSGDRNHHLLDGFKYVGKGKLSGAVMYSAGGYPCVVDSPYENNIVHGEVYSDEDDRADIWTRLDHLEGTPHMYKRVPRWIALSETVSIIAETYIWNLTCSHLERVESGIWEIILVQLIDYILRPRKVQSPHKQGLVDKARRAFDHQIKLHTTQDCCGTSESVVPRTRVQADHQNERGPHD